MADFLAFQRPRLTALTESPMKCKNISLERRKRPLPKFIRTSAYSTYRGVFAHMQVILVMLFQGTFPRKALLYPVENTHCLRTLLLSSFDIISGRLPAPAAITFGVLGSGSTSMNVSLPFVS